MDTLRQKQVQLMFARVSPTATEMMEQQFVKHYNDNDRFMLEPGKTIVDVFDRQVQRSPLHLVFCLDGSWSMKGSNWTALQLAYQKLLQTRIDHQGMDDMVSVLVFDTNAHIQFRYQPIVSAPRQVDRITWGTKFAPALRAAHGLLTGSDANGHTPVLIFMSDGCSTDSKDEQLAVMKQIVDSCGSQLNMYTVPFGKGADQKRLLDLAAAAPKGTMKPADDAASMLEVFEDIAHRCSAVNGMVGHFSQIITRMVTDKITVDHM